MSARPGCSRRKAVEMAVSLAASPARPRGGLQALPACIFLAFALVPLVALLTRDIYLVRLGSPVMIFAIAAVALDLLVGYGALISFGHAAFIGLGAYAMGILSVYGITDALVSLPVALAVSALYAFLTGVICLRTSGVYFIMITLAFGQMAFFAASSLAPFGGDDGLTIAARNTLAGFPLLRDERAFYYVVFFCLLGTYLFCRALIASRFGRVVRGAKENPVRMATIGFDVYRFQLATYVIAGALAGLSGFLLANATEFVSPAYMSWQRSGELIVMVLLGGLGSLDGAIIGAAAYLLTEEWLSGFTENWKVIFGPVLVLVVLFARGGLIPLPPAFVRRFPRRSRGAAPGQGAQVVRCSRRHRRPDVRRHAGRAACRHRAERRRQDHADQSNFRAGRSGCGDHSVRRARHHRLAHACARGARLGAIVPGEFDPSRLLGARECRARGAIARGLELPCARPGGGGGGVERSSNGGARGRRFGRTRAHPRGRAFPWRETRARTRHCACDAAQGPAAR